MRRGREFTSVALYEFQEEKIKNVSLGEKSKRDYVSIEPKRFDSITIQQCDPLEGAI